MSLITLPFSQDPLAKSKSTWNIDDADDTITVAEEHDVTDVVEEAVANYNSFDEKARWKGDLHRVASVPMVIYWKLYADGTLDDPKRLKAWLNDKDNRAFRTRPGLI